jgi:hypothetical protein
VICEASCSRAERCHLDGRFRPVARNASTGQKPVQPDLSRGRVWVTRKDVHVDRIASSWLIRRFIDPKARFKFVPPQGYRPRKAELRFDMFEAEFTHEEIIAASKPWSITSD